MQQITEMASAMGLQTQTADVQAEQPIIEEALQQFSQVLHKTEAKDKKQQTLMQALIPYLSPRRQIRLERAMKLSHISRLAGAALQNSSLTSILSEEDLHV